MLKMYWLVRFYKNGFEGTMMVYGTEEDLWDYLNSEIGGGDARHTGNYSYRGATAAEIEAANILRIKTYLCPEVTHHYN